MARLAGVGTLIVLLMSHAGVMATEPGTLDLGLQQSDSADGSVHRAMGGWSTAQSQSSVDLSLVINDRPATLVQMSMTPESTADAWVLVAPYVWATAQRGTIGARGQTAQVDVTLADLVELIPDLNGAAMAHLEFGKGNAGLIFDAMFMQIEPSEGLPFGGELELETSSTILETLGMLRVVDIPQSETAGSLVTVDLLGGARYYQFQNAIRITPAVGPTIQADMSKDWVDLVIGARTAVAVTPELSGFLRADIAGFGIGTSSDLTWNLTTGAEYACAALPGSSLVLGYRILSIDETQKTGANKFVYDVTLHGPFTAIAFRF